MKLFGEFLVEKNILTNEQLLGVLLDQIKSTPTIPELVIKNKLLPEDEILKIFRRQVVQRTPFTEAAKLEGLWTEELNQSVEKLTTLNRMPLGQIVIKLGYATVDEMTKALDEFLGGVTVNDVQNGVNQQITPDISHSTKVASSDSLTTGISTDFTAFTDLAEETARVLTSAGALTGDSKLNLDLIKSAYQELHKLKGAARISNLQIMTNLINHYEDCLKEICNQSISQFDSELSKKISNHMCTFSDRVVKIAKAMAAGSDEATAFKSLESDFKAQDWEDGLLLLKFDLGLSIS